MIEDRNGIGSYSTLIEQSPDLIASHNRDGVCRYISPACREMMGYEPEEMLGHTFFEFVHPADQEQARKDFVKAISQRGAIVVSYQARRKDGSTIWLETTYKALRDAHSNQVQEILSFSRDISRAKHIESALQIMGRGGEALSADDFFRPLVSHIATALQVSFAFVTETNPASTHVKMLAFWKGKDFAEPYEYPLEDTPCSDVIHGPKTCYYPMSVQVRFPKDKDLTDLKAQGYLGIPIFDLAGHVIGHLAIIDSKALVLEEPGLSILKIFAVRAGIEIERRRLANQVN